MPADCVSITVSLTTDCATAVHYYRKGLWLWGAAQHATLYPTINIHGHSTVLQVQSLAILLTLQREAMDCRPINRMSRTVSQGLSAKDCRPIYQTFGFLVLLLHNITDHKLIKQCNYVYTELKLTFCFFNLIKFIKNKYIYIYIYI